MSAIAAMVKQIRKVKVKARVPRYNNVCQCGAPFQVVRWQRKRKFCSVLCKYKFYVKPSGHKMPNVKPKPHWFKSGEPTKYWHNKHSGEGVWRDDDRRPSGS